MVAPYRMTKKVHLSKEKRSKILDQTISSIERGVPDDVLVKKLLYETEYSISGVKNILQEAHIKADNRKMKEERLA